MLLAAGIGLFSEDLTKDLSLLGKHAHFMLSHHNTSCLLTTTLLALSPQHFLLSHHNTSYLLTTTLLAFSQQADILSSVT